MRRTIAAPEFAHYPEAWRLSPALEAGGFVFFSGQTGVRADGSLASEPEGQFRDAFAHLGATLAAAGLGFGDIVEMTTYHVGLRRRLEAFVRVKDRHVTAPYPAWSAIGVTELITDGAVVELRVIALRPTARNPAEPIGTA